MDTYDVKAVLVTEAKDKADLEAFLVDVMSREDHQNDNFVFDIGEALGLGRKLKVFLDWRVSGNHAENAENGERVTFAELPY